MTTRPPQVHIGMAVFNEGKYLDATLTALREQTFSDFTLLLCDNASTDETEGIARRHARTMVSWQSLALALTADSDVSFFDPAFPAAVIVHGQVPAAGH